MPVHSETRPLPYTPAQLYDLVAAVDRSPELLPWCRAARILRRTETALEADLVIGFKMVRERFRSRVSLTPKHRITVEDAAGPFEHLRNDWRFEDDPAGCKLIFTVDFEFRSPFLRRIMGVLFHEAVKKLVAAFEGRAAALYGPDALARAAE